MHINKQSNKKKYLLAATITVLVAGLVYVGIAYKNDFWPFTKTADDQNAMQDTANESPKNNNSAKKSDTKETINPDMTTDQVPVSDKLSASITQLEQAGDEVKISAKIDNSPSVGRCVIIFSNPNDRPLTKEVDATLQDGSALCGPLSIPALEFSYIGEWTATVRYYLGEEQAVAEKKVVIK